MAAYMSKKVRYVIAVPLSRVTEFNRLMQELKSLQPYDMITADWVPHDKIYVADENGIVQQYDIDGEYDSVASFHSCLHDFELLVAH